MPYCLKQYVDSSRPAYKQHVRARSRLHHYRSKRAHRDSTILLEDMRLTAPHLFPSSHNVLVTHPHFHIHFAAVQLSFHIVYNF